MFGKWRNNYYYGKSGQGDFRRDDLPHNRWQLFWAMLRTRLAGLCRLNLTVCLAWLPLIVVVYICMEEFIKNWQSLALHLNYLETGVMHENLTAEAVAAFEDVLKTTTIPQLIESVIFTSLWKFCLWCIPCIAITGPVQAGLAYVCRNWSRDEHAFAWDDFKDAVKGNWKQGLLISCITSIMPMIAYTSYDIYGKMADAQGVFFLIPQMLVLTMVALWMLSLVFMYPIMVTYEVKNMALIKNGLTLAVARLPHTVGLRLLTLVPAIIAVAVFYFTSSPLPLLILAAYYLLIGFAMVRFIHASFANGVFDKYINSRLEGVQVNRGLAVDDDDEDEDEEEETTLSE